MFVINEKLIKFTVFGKSFFVQRFVDDCCVSAHPELVTKYLKVRILEKPVITKGREYPPPCPSP
jgi:hypothetical protein